MDNTTFSRVITRLEAYLAGKDPPIVSRLSEGDRDPFLILISTVLSSRTKDEITSQATAQLFSRAHNAQDMLSLPQEEIAQLIYPVGFYRTKARLIHEICRDLLARFGGNVPSNLDDLLSLPGVGRKTANLVLALAFDDDAICVDTHVHRITNRLGYLHTRNPQETEEALREKLPRPFWKRLNTLLVKFGQDICRPLSPLCSQCPISGDCERVGISRHR